MRKPLRTKKTLTEMNPPDAQPRPLWLAMIPMMEMARIPSRAGTYKRRRVTPGGAG